MDPNIYVKWDKRLAKILRFGQMEVVIEGGKTNKGFYFPQKTYVRYSPVEGMR